MKSCGECYMCCTGILTHVVNGQRVGGDVDCPYISRDVTARCSIYNQPERAPQCDGFACTWLLQDSWPEEMRPDKSGVMGVRKHGQPLRVTYTPHATEYGKQFVDQYAAARSLTVKKIISIYPITKER